MDRLRADLKDASIQQYDNADAHSVLIRLPEQRKESDYAGQIVAKLVHDLNPEADSNKLDLNYQGRAAWRTSSPPTTRTQKAQTTTRRSTTPTWPKRSSTSASELGLFTSMSQISAVPGVTSNVSRVLSDKAFLGAFNVRDQETVGPQVGRELQQKAILGRRVLDAGDGSVSVDSFRPDCSASLPSSASCTTSWSRCIPGHDQRGVLANIVAALLLIRRLLDQRHRRHV